MPTYKDREWGEFVMKYTVILWYSVLQCVTCTAQWVRFMMVEILFHSDHSKVAEKVFLSVSTRMALKVMLLNEDMIPKVHVTLVIYLYLTIPICHSSPSICFHSCSPFCLCNTHSLQLMIMIFLFSAFLVVFTQANHLLLCANIVCVLLLCKPIVRCVCKIAERDYWLCHVFLSIYLSFCLEQLNWTDFHEIWYLSIFLKICWKKPSFIEIWQ